VALCGAPEVHETESASVPRTSSDASCCCCADKTRAGLLLASLNTEAAEPAIELKKVKLAKLLDDIKSHEGKLVVVDIWADYCIPCKKGFPHLVALHKERAKDGLVCISVSVDEPEDHAKALKFLEKQQAMFANYHLDERAETWQDHFNIKGIPAVVLYRDGKKLAQFDHDDPDNQFTYADVEKAVSKFLQK
jgi:thiol-disulfide isomerase/thioredoxin